MLVLKLTLSIGLAVLALALLNLEALTTIKDMWLIGCITIVVVASAFCFVVHSIGRTAVKLANSSAAKALSNGK